MLDEAAGAWGSPGAGDAVGLWHRNGFSVLSMINTNMTCLTLGTGKPESLGALRLMAGMLWVAVGS